MKRNGTYSSLKEWRDAKAYTQVEAAQRLAISQSQYSKLENKRQGARRFTAKRIADQTGVPLEAVLGVA